MSPSSDLLIIRDIISDIMEVSDLKELRSLLGVSQNFFDGHPTTMDREMMFSMGQESFYTEPDNYISRRDYPMQPEEVEEEPERKVVFGDSSSEDSDMEDEYALNVNSYILDTS